MVESADMESLAEMRHNLRTPLNQIIGYCELLMEEVNETGCGSCFPDLQKIHTASGQLLAMINEALAPWRLEEGVLDLEALQSEARTPLNLILAYAESCQDTADDCAHAQVLPDLQHIVTAANNLMSLLTSLEFPRQIEVKPQPTAPQEAAIPGGGTTLGQPMSGAILVVDDNEKNRDIVSRRLERQGFTVTEAANGQEALDLISRQPFDLILLDVVMPVMDGYTALTLIKADEKLRQIPVIMLSAQDEMESVVRCLEVGADDYMTKPFNLVVLKARIAACLTKKFLLDQEREHAEMLQIERHRADMLRKKSDALLLNLLPAAVAERLQNGETNVADHFENASVLVAGLDGFEELTEKLSPLQTVELLNNVFSQFDWLVELHGLEKIRTVGETYLAAAGVPVARADHCDAIGELALGMQKALQRLSATGKTPLKLRLGLSTGPVVAGVIGRKKFVYDLWGKPIRTARRLEAACAPDGIRVCPAIHQALARKYQFREAEVLENPGGETMKTYYLLGRISLGPKSPAGGAPPMTFGAQKRGLNR